MPLSHSYKEVSRTVVYGFYGKIGGRKILHCPMEKSILIPFVIIISSANPMSVEPLHLCLHFLLRHQGTKKAQQKANTTHFMCLSCQFMRREASSSSIFSSRAFDFLLSIGTTLNCLEYYMSLRSNSLNWWFRNLSEGAPDVNWNDLSRQRNDLKSNMV